MNNRIFTPPKKKAGEPTAAEVQGIATTKIPDISAANNLVSAKISALKSSSDKNDLNEIERRVESILQIEANPDKASSYVTEGRRIETATKNGKLRVRKRPSTHSIDEQHTEVNRIAMPSDYEGEDLFCVRIWKTMHGISYEAPDSRYGNKELFSADYEFLPDVPNIYISGQAYMDAPELFKYCLGYETGDVPTYVADKGGYWIDPWEGQTVVITPMYFERMGDIHLAYTFDQPIFTGYVPQPEYFPEGLKPVWIYGAASYCGKYSYYTIEELDVVIKFRITFTASRSELETFNALTDTYKNDPRWPFYVWNHIPIPD